MKIIGITGGIGSGKSTVAKLIEEQGFPVYNSDVRAKEITNNSPIIKNQLIEWYGEDMYKNNKLNKEKLAKIIFNNKAELEKVNHLIHPEVFKDFEEWKNQQTTDFIFKEAAILFESGSYKNCDAVLTISAPINIRIQRAMERDNSSKEDIQKRIEKQWNDKKRESKANFIIKNNSSFKDLEKKVDYFLKNLKNTPIN
ncbi:dephospho-CoA kinase [Weeksellaceae bacterium TAE3-ERU29]|nr:dephospho-CoA kinase [Weeksellaceae bacterium TAE3-ERU29]